MAKKTDPKAVIRALNDLMTAWAKASYAASAAAASCKPEKGKPIAQTFRACGNGIDDLQPILVAFETAIKKVEAQLKAVDAKSELHRLGTSQLDVARAKLRELTQEWKRHFKTYDKYESMLKGITHK